MKDLNVYISVHIDEDDGDAVKKLFEERLYLALPPEVVLEDETRGYLVAATARLVERAMSRVRASYRPDLEAAS